MPDTIERYVHRVGRTGRAGKTGLAVTFISNDDEETMYELKIEIEKSPLSKMNPELARHEAARQKVTKEMKVRILPVLSVSIAYERSGNEMSREERNDRRVEQLGNLASSPDHSGVFCV